MAKYNLLDDDDIFDEKEEISTDDNDLNIEPESPKSGIDMTDDIDINIDDDDDILETEPSSSLDDQDFQTDLDITAIDSDGINESIDEPEIEGSEPSSYVEYQTEEEVQEKEKYSESPPFITDDYEDTKQEGLNYKPFLIAIIIIAGLTGLWFAIDTFVLSDEPAVVEEPAQSPEQMQKEKEDAEKAAFLSQIAGKTSSDINLVSEILGYGKNNAKVSSILLYKKSLLFEVFGSSRDQVAKVNMSLKNKASRNSFEVIGSETRPGSNGGVFGLFKTEVIPSSNSKNVSRASFSSVNDFQSWIQKASSSSELKVTDLKNTFLQEEGYFKKFEVEATISGSLDGCNEFLQKLSSDNNQVKINKLNLTAADQKNFQTKKYLLKLVLQVYV